MRTFHIPINLNLNRRDFSPRHNPKRCNWCKISKCCDGIGARYIPYCSNLIGARYIPLCSNLIGARNIPICNSLIGARYRPKCGDLIGASNIPLYTLTQCFFFNSVKTNNSNIRFNILSILWTSSTELHLRFQKKTYQATVF